MFCVCVAMALWSVALEMPIFNSVTKLCCRLLTHEERPRRACMAGGVNPQTLPPSSCSATLSARLLSSQSPDGPPLRELCVRSSREQRKGRWQRVWTGPFVLLLLPPTLFNVQNKAILEALSSGLPLSPLWLEFGHMSPWKTVFFC